MTKPTFAWNTLLVALPLSHLLLTSFYLWFWAVGFGANTIVLADPSDIFRVSVAELLPIYFSGFIAPGTFALWRWTLKHPTASHATDSIEDPEARAKQARRDKRIRLIIVAGCVIILVEGAFGMWMNYHQGRAIFPLALYALNGPAVAMLYRLNARLQLDVVPWEVLLLVVNLVIAAMTTGSRAVKQRAMLITSTLCAAEFIAGTIWSYAGTRISIWPSLPKAKECFSIWIAK